MEAESTTTPAVMVVVVVDAAVPTALTKSDARTLTRDRPDGSDFTGLCVSLTSLRLPCRSRAPGGGLGTAGWTRAFLSGTLEAKVGAADMFGQDGK